jgi:hypothetical protein
MMFIDSTCDGEQSTGSKHLNTVQDQNSSFSFKQQMKQHNNRTVHE